MRLTKRHKYDAQATVVDGIRFDSRKEANRYRELRLLEKAGNIRNLQLQPRFVLWVPGGDMDHALGEYRADFAYTENKCHELVIEDVKGFKTPLYRWKKKHVEAQYGVTIREV